MKIDPRTKLIIVLVIGVFTFMTSETGLMILAGSMAAYMVCNAMAVRAVKYCASFAVLYILLRLMYMTENKMAAIFGLVTFYILRFIPVIMAAAVLSETSPGLLIASLQKMGLPKAVVIPIAVGLRFMPSFFIEYSSIRDASRLRGVSMSLRNLFTKPILTFECAYVPIMMRSLSISDSLAASAYTRGLDSPEKRTSMHESKLGTADLFVFVLLAGLVAGLLYLGRS